MQKFTFHSLMTVPLTLKLRDVTPMSPSDEEWNTVDQFKISGIIIPKIQRDYAQGRCSEDVDDIRNDFVDALFDALSEIPGSSKCSLNFIYGQLLKEKVGRDKVSFIPLDGQQRLTTLFLLHWYLSRLEKRSGEFDYLINFRYEIRYTSSEFTTMFLDDIKDLTLSDEEIKWFGKRGKKTKVGEIVPSDEFSNWLKNKPHFSDNWLADPTVSGMLVMLDSIHNKFRNSADKGFLKKLKRSPENCPIYFYFKQIDPIADGGELFIKMNSRGKLLTEYEFFKADFQRILKKAKVPEQIRIDTAKKLDKKWEPSFWGLVQKIEELNKSENPALPEFIDLHSASLDDYMMRFVNFAIDSLGFSHRNRSEEGDIMLVFDKQNPNSLKYHRKRLEELLLENGAIVEERLNDFLDFLDIWTSENKNDYPGYDFFKKTFSKTANPDKKTIVLFGDTQCQMLLSILIDKSSGDNRFALTSEAAVLFFAATWARILKLDKNDAESKLRAVRNLHWRTDRQTSYMPNIFRHIRLLMKKGCVDEVFSTEESGKSFNKEQIREEIYKASVASDHPAFFAEMRDLEESQWFLGSVANLLSDNYDQKPIIQVATEFHKRKSAFENSFGALGADIPNNLIRDILFWAGRRPYCILEKNSWYSWGANSGDFRWMGGTRPFLSRNAKPIKEALLAVLDIIEIKEEENRQPTIRGKELLEALKKQLKEPSAKNPSGTGYSAAYYMVAYYDLFFDLWNNCYPKNLGRMLTDEGSFLSVNLYSRIDRKKDYWDPYLYSMWKLSEIGEKVSGIVKSWDTTWAAASFIEQKIVVENKKDRFEISGPRQSLDRLKIQYGDIKIRDDANNTGNATATFPIPRHPTNKLADAIDRIQKGVELFKAISSLPPAAPPATSSAESASEPTP